MAPGGKRVLIVGVSAAAAVALFVGGRLSADSGGSSATGYRAGYAAGLHDGLAQGQAQGRAEGRALQAPLALPTGSRDVAKSAFTAGYAAGANDVFAGYDGGWGLGSPYVITLGPGSAGVTYRIASRLELQPGTSYYLCPQSTVCHEPRR
jgi:hypothetical protein